MITRACSPRVPAAWIGFACLAAASILPLAARAQGAPSATSPAEQIFERARDYWSSQTYPALLDYVIAVTVHEGSSSASNHYEAEYVVADDKLRVNTISAEERAHPSSPRGTNIVLSLSLSMGRGGGQTSSTPPLNREVAPDHLGVPLLTPTYSFGIARSGARHVVQRTSSGDRLRIIGRTGTISHTYAVTLIGLETIDEHSTYHLALKPLTAPRKYRLRELWVDASTYETRKAVVDGNFDVGPGVLSAWTISFRSIDGALYIESEAAQRPLRFGKHVYANATVSFEDVHGSASWPSLRFALPQNDDNAIREPGF